MEQRGQFTFYRSYYEALQSLPKKDREPVLMAICAYALDGTEAKLSGIGAAIFALVKPTLDTGRKRAEIGKQGGSKREANAKQNESKTEAKPTQTASEKEKEKEGEREEEREKEKENECSISPPTPSPGDREQKEKPLSPEERVRRTFYDDSIVNALISWIAYKRERREFYKDKGITALLSTADKHVREYGPEAVAEVIRESMANQYQGIVWDRLKRRKEEERRANKSKLPGMPKEGGRDDLEKLMKQLGVTA